MLLVVSASLHPASRSRIMAREVHAQLENIGQAAQFLDLRDYDLPLCDGSSAYGHPDVQRVGPLLREADGVLLATPIYNYDVSAALKNLVELTGKSAWQDKVVGFLCAAGGEGSYMSTMGLANSLMLDFRCFILPRFVYATGRAFDEDRIVDEDVRQRIAELAGNFAQITHSLAALIESRESS